MKGKTHADNSRLTNVSRQTISKWAKQNDWEQKRAQLEAATTDKYIDKVSTQIVTDVHELDSSHRSMIQKIKKGFNQILEDEQASEVDMRRISWLLNHAGPLIALERKVTGLDKMSLKKLEFPQAFAVTIQTNNGPISFQPNKLTHDQSIDLLSILPNQNPERFGEGDHIIEEEDDDDENPAEYIAGGDYDITDAIVEGP